MSLQFQREFLQGVLACSSTAAGACCLAAYSAHRPDCSSRGLRCDTLPLTEQEVLSYHAMQKKLSSVKSLQDAVQPRDSNIGWDHSSGRAVPGRIWHETMPREQVREILKDYTPAEKAEVRRITGIDDAEPTSVPKVLIVLGPAGVGKSTKMLKAASLIDIEMSNFVKLDGDEMRAVHNGWRALVDENAETGFKDAMTVWKKSPARKYKDELTAEAIRDRKNIVLSVTNMSVDQLKEFNGYEICLIGLIATFDVASLRQLNRAQFCGRWPDTGYTSWKMAADHMLKLAAPEYSDRAIIIDNTNFDDSTILYSRIHRLPNVLDAFAKTLLRSSRSVVDCTHERAQDT